MIHLDQNLNIQQTLQQMTDAHQKMMRMTCGSMEVLQDRAIKVNHMAWDQLTWATQRATDMWLNCMDACSKGSTAWQRNMNG